MKYNNRNDTKVKDEMSGISINKIIPLKEAKEIVERMLITKVMKLSFD